MRVCDTVVYHHVCSARKRERFADNESVDATRKMLIGGSWEIIAVCIIYIVLRFPRGKLYC